MNLSFRPKQSEVEKSPEVVKRSLDSARDDRSGKLIVIVGETASGKSALAMEVARRFNGEIICADAMTVYKGFDIGTAKPSEKDRADVPHHLLDVADAAEGFTAAEF